MNSTVFYDKIKFVLSIDDRPQYYTKYIKIYKPMEMAQATDYMYWHVWQIYT